jgi:GNAT superfamily N-acetyltransferase
MNMILNDFSASSIVEAIEINAHEAWICLAHGLGAIVYDEPHMLWFFSGLGLALLLELVSKHAFKGDPSVRFYIGRLEDKPVATSLLYLGGGVAGIYNVATLPEFRHQGIGSALTVAPLLQARTWGYRIGTLQSTPMGLHLYRQLGFREYCTFQAYFWQ